MAKNKPRWETVNAYELAKKRLLNQATPEEAAAAKQAMDIRQAGGKPKISNAGGRLVVR